MFLSKQAHMFDYFICYHLESGWHVTRPQPGSFSRERKELGNEVEAAEGWQNERTAQSEQSE